MKNRAGLWCLLFGLVLSMSLPAAGPGMRLSFEGLDLSGDNRLLFRAASGGGQRAVFVSRLTDLALQQITAFPEQMELVENGRTLLVWNSFGAVRIPSAGGLPQPVPGFPSFAAGTAPLGGRSLALAASADGRWILYVEPSSPAYGRLILLDVSGGVKRVISEQVELPEQDFPASWSPDSRLFIYAKGGRLFYYAIGHTSVQLDERYRLIGEGGISAVHWGPRGDFFYFRGDTLYLVRGPELYTRTLYGDFLSIGSAVGRFPVDFDPLFDRFWLAPDYGSILFLKAGRSVFYYPLGDSAAAPLPYAMIPGGAYQVNVLWSASGLITVVASVMAGNQTLTWRFETAGTRAASFVPSHIPPSSRCALSPDGARALFWGETGVEVWDYVNWRPVQDPSTERVYSCVWLNNGEYAAGDGRRIERISIAGPRRLLCLSDADEYGFEEGGESARMLARSGEVWFASDGRNPWIEAAESRLRAASQASGRYRVYLEARNFGPYENIPMIRTITPAGAASLAAAVLPPAVWFEEERRPAAGGGSGLSNNVFTNGRRDGKRQVALCFDLYNDDTGLPRTLDVLRRFGLTATFFMNGDFIRGKPAAAAAIAGAGHEAASLFYAPIDLADSRYRVSDEYIAQGLARNEDDYHEATGQELSFLWHPPFYRISAEISAAAARAAYLTVGRDVDPMDWLSREEARRLGVYQYSASEMVERIMAAKQPGSIIPVRLGLQSGGRDDYLFLRLETLLDALVRAGYTIVPVSALTR
jgi:peptidoglycan/xylan/chitin deacetylase (PgdA/CDA1 family)